MPAPLERGGAAEANRIRQCEAELSRTRRFLTESSCSRPGAAFYSGLLPSRPVAVLFDGCSLSGSWHEHEAQRSHPMVPRVQSAVFGSRGRGGVRAVPGMRARFRRRAASRDCCHPAGRSRSLDVPGLRADVFGARGQDDAGSMSGVSACSVSRISSGGIARGFEEPLEASRARVPRDAPGRRCSVDRQRDTEQRGCASRSRSNHPGCCRTNGASAGWRRSRG